VADQALDFPVSLPIDLPTYLHRLEDALEAARSEGNLEVAGLDVGFFLGRLRTVYITAALNQAKGNVSRAAALLGLGVDELRETLFVPALC